MKTALRISTALSLISHQTARTIYRGLLLRNQTKIQRGARLHYMAFMSRENAVK